MSNLLSEIEFRTKIVTSAFICSVLLAAVSCSSYKLKIKSNVQVLEAPTIKMSNTPEAINSLEQATAIRLKELYDNKDCKEFFNAFPNTFQEFNQLYGYDEEEGERILFSKSEEHINYFFDCSEVSSLERLNKVIRIGIGGKWDADAVWMLQEASFKLVKTDTDEAKEILDNLPDEKASSFWHFLLDGPHPNNEKNAKRVDLLSNLLGKESKQSKLLLEQFQKLKDLDKH